MKKIITKKIVLILVAVVWIGFSTYYMANNEWQKFQNTKMQAAYQKGVSDSVKTLMNEAGKCKTVPLFDGDQKMEVVSVECLQKANEQAQKKQEEK